VFPAVRIAHQDTDVLAPQLRRPVPEHRQRGGIDHLDRPPLVDGDDAVDRRIENRAHERAVVLLAPAQDFRVLLELADVLRDRGEARGLALLVGQEAQRDQHGIGDAALRDPELLDVPDIVPAEAARPELGGGRLTVRRQQRLDRLADELLARPAVDALGLAVQVDHHTGEVLDDDRVRRVPEHLRQPEELRLRPLADLPQRRDAAQHERRPDAGNTGREERGREVGAEGG